MAIWYLKSDVAFHLDVHTDDYVTSSRYRGITRD